ncbi:MAG: molybdopterin-dependent oxidoreductase [Candidatus Eremiobacteraeota bacterium]|nr:molybdopterin-dependent oxidoreductase [Candidatus Eremiobacteraeota bacterium]
MASLLRVDRRPVLVRLAGRQRVEWESARDGAQTQRPLEAVADAGVLSQAAPQSARLRRLQSTAEGGLHHGALDCRAAGRDHRARAFSGSRRDRASLDGDLRRPAVRAALALRRDARAVGFLRDPRLSSGDARGSESDALHDHGLVSPVKRRLFIASSLSALAGCGPISAALNDNDAVRRALASVEPLNHRLIGTRGVAREYAESDVDRHFRVNGFATPSDSHYADLLASKFARYRLIVDGAVDRPQTFSLSALERLGARTQITRHDCVEGWSAIGKWSGVPLPDVLDAVRPRSDARYVVFRCMDNDGAGTLYYESLDLQQARHPQTLLALRLNDAPLDPEHGAPVRLRVPTQLGYKSAKWIARIEVVGSLANIGGGHGGYWEDQGYEWYAGI